MKFNFSYHYYIRIYVCLIWCQDVSKLQSFIHSFFRFYWKERNVCDLIRSTKEVGIILNKIKIENEEEMGMGRLCVMKQTKALQNSVVSMTHLVLSVKAKKIALFVLYLLFIRRQNILSYWIQYFHFLKKIHILFELFELVQKNRQKNSFIFY